MDCMKTIINFIFLLSIMYIFSTSTKAYAAGSMTSEKESERISFIQKEFDESRLYTSIWWYGWMGVYTASAGVSFGVAAASDDKTVRITQTVSGVQSVIGLAGLVFSPIPPAYAAGTFHDMPESSSDERMRKLKEGERLLKETSDVEEFGSSWVTHLLNFAVGASGALVIWKVYDDEIEDAGGDPQKEALYNFILSFGIGELQIFTQPTRGIKAWNRYRELFNPDSSAGFFIVPQYGGMAAGAVYRF